MNFSFTTKREMGGKLSVITIEPLFIERRNFCIELRTCKGNRGIASRCYVFEHTSHNTRTMDLFGDYSATILQNATARATEKTLLALHQQALETFAEHVKKATAHTLAKAEKAAKEKAEYDERIKAKQAWPFPPAADSAEAKQAAAAAMDDFNYVGSPAHY